ncbi:MAG: 4-(cytidine 5'-diphospho)-2-C-methyl-D-erythritol kinase [Candidatus Thioglobus sp.]|nr:MAG: 4-(cytidine 5'-diphospho)-2-C-methyl-D-erythritol kinase [Candidatus Thioglobus sp.]KAA0446841.1 MAG: 4-(cytidine 5'-diphospho)-2-C-methyl-D-erythritol kinase [Candidatus Thioglobus sp.]
MPKTWQSPAKINLFLHINCKRKDGYHNLQTIFQLLDYCDELNFSVRDDGVINRSGGNEAVPEADDLIIKAAKALQKSAGVNLGADISVHKKIPAGGGLGGGSSNAATTLKALNQLWGVQYSTQQLSAIGLKLGADVPIFIAGQSAWAEGVGEILTPISLPKRYFLVVCINKSISTKEIFLHKALTTTPILGKIHAFSELANPHNDCLEAAIELEGEILAALTHLKSAKNYLYEPRMTGTGCCVFAEFEAEKDALIALNNVPKQWSGFVAPALDSSPILTP